MYYDVEIIRPQRTAVIAAGKKEFIDEFVSVLEGANFRPIGLYVEALAITKALLSGKEDDERGIIVVDLGLARTTVIFHMNSSVHFTTSYPSVLQDGAVNQDHLSAALQQVVQYYQSHFQDKAELVQIVLCGSGAYIANITDSISTITGVETVQGDPFQALQENHLSNKMEQPLVYTTAIGLTLLDE